MATSSKRALTREQVHETLWALAVEQSGRAAADILPNHSLIKDLGLDSLDVAEMTMALEEKLEIVFPGEDTEKGDLTMGDVEEAVCKHCL